MSLILEKHRGNLRSLIGKKINYSLVPHLSVIRKTKLPFRGIPHSEDALFFFSTHFNLRIEDINSNLSWLKFSSGIEEEGSWASLFVEKINHPDFGSCQPDLSIFNKEYYSKILKGVKSSLDLQNEFLDASTNSLGLNRCAFWDDSVVEKVELFKDRSSAVVIVIHESGFEWMMYSISEDEFWISFDKQLIVESRIYSQANEVFR